MTSIYRQVGISCEHLFRQILIDTAEYENDKMASWSYSAKTKSGKEKKLSLDGRLGFSDIKNEGLLNRSQKWLGAYCKQIKARSPKNGIVFEVRQGYKSKDTSYFDIVIIVVVYLWVIIRMVLPFRYFHFAAKFLNMTLQAFLSGTLNESRRTSTKFWNFS
jgi:hypothetical protein